MKNNLIVIALILVLPLAGCRKSTVVKETTSTPTGPVELKFKWPVGRTMVQHMSLKQHAEVSCRDLAPMKQDMDTDQDYRLTVLRETPDAGHEIEIEFLEVRLSLKKADQTIKYDSTKKVPDEPDPAVTMFSKMIGAKLVYAINASNRVQKVHGVSEFQSRLAAGGAGAMIKQMFNEEYFKQVMSNLLLIPDHPVQPGDSWPVKRDVNMGDGMTSVNFTNTLENWELHDSRYCARISINGTIERKRGENMDITFANGRSTGQALFDVDMGMFVETTVEQDMKTLITIPAPKPGDKSETMTNVVHQTMVTKVDSVN
jgi:hypothetical protein